MNHRAVRIFPATTMGKWSFGLIVLMPLLILVGTLLVTMLYASVPAGGTILADISARPALALTMLAGITAGVVSFITGLLAIFRAKERAILVFLATAIGGILVFFLAGEFLFPD